MRSRMLLLGAATIAPVASGATKTANLEPGVKLPPAVWGWSGGYIGGQLPSNLLHQSLRSVDLWRCRQVRCHPAQPAPVDWPRAAFLLGRCAGPPAIAMRLPRAVRATGGSSADHRRGGRRLHAVLRHSLPAAPAGHLPPFHRSESEVPPCPSNPCRRCRCGASITSSPRPRC